MDYQTEFKSIKMWAVEDRPREKMMSKGVDALTDAELIAILLATGTREMSAIDLAKKMIQDLGGFSQLARASSKQLMTIKGIGEAKALTLVAALELGRRKAREEAFSLQIKSADTAARYLMEKIGDSEQEIFYALFLDRKNCIKSEKMISLGSISATLIDVRIVMREAVQHLASAMIVAHNHPSGNLNPSQADKDITYKLKEAGKLFDIPVLDHVIVTGKGYFSFAENGIL